VLIGSPRIAPAQVAEATVVGRIQDPSGAVMPQVEVQMKRVSTNEVFSTRTTDTGDYTISNLPVGTYEMQVSIPGFRTEVRTGITLEVGRTYRFDFALTISQVAERTEVVAEAPVLKTESPEVSQVIDNTKIVDLPLNGRDVVGSLASLAPGISPAKGARVGANTFGNYNIRGMRTQDTMVMVDGSMMSQNNGQMTYIQSPDSTQEFEIKTGLYGAEYGVRPGGVISVVTKSGTNELHGTAFEFLRNAKVDARNFFDRGSRPPYKRNQFGATLGGPIYVPRLFKGKDKAWFFFSWQGQRQRQFQSFTGIVPTAAQKAGIFSSAINDPLTGQPFENNTIPAQRISDVSKRFLGFWPDSNTAGALNYTCPVCAVKDDRHQVIAKGDFKTSANDRWSARFIYDYFPIRQTPTIQLFARVDPLATWAQNITNTHTFRNTIVNEFSVHYFKRPYSPGGGSPSGSPQDFDRSLGLPNFPRSVADGGGVLKVNVPGLLPLGDATYTGKAPIGDWPEIKENLAFYKGSHSFKAGYQLRRNFSFNTFSQRSSLTFSSRYTGNAFADFLLGDLTSSTLGADTFFGDLSQVTHSVYLQDDWKATSKLNVNLGLRYEYRGSWEDHSGFSSNFNLATGQLDPPFVPNPALPIGQTGRYQANVPLVQMSKKSILPRVGLAYRLARKTVIRAGYGAYSNEPYFNGYWQLGGNPRQNAVLGNFFADLATPTLSLSNPFPVSSTAAPLLSPYGIQNPLPQMVVHSWGLSVQQELSPNTSIEIGYQGSRTLHEFTLNDINAATPGAGPLQQRRPYPAFSYITMWLANGDAHYNGLEVKLQRRASRDGLSLLVAYTFSKSIDITSCGTCEQISRNLPTRLNRGMGDGSVPGRLVVTPGYQSPFGPGKTFLTNSPFGHVLGGWIVFGILTMQAGDYSTANMPSDSLNVGSTASFRPNVLADPNLPASQRTPQHWFATSSFVTPPPFTYGNAGRNIIKGPNVRNLDLALLRDFKLYERMTLQARFEAFNSTNHTNFQDPGTTFATGGFGVIGGAYESRDLQFGLKLVF
jgi:outer membrane receptor protein involved in Fe transport